MWYFARMQNWGFLTNHALVLLCIARDPGARLRDIAVSVGITERSAFAIVSDLAVAGYRQGKGRPPEPLPHRDSASGAGIGRQASRHRRSAFSPRGPGCRTS
jgi:hypothetical protein